MDAATAKRTPPLAWLFPRADESGADLTRRTTLRIGISVLTANLLGAAIAYQTKQEALEAAGLSE